MPLGFIRDLNTLTGKTYSAGFRYFNNSAAGYSNFWYDNVIVFNENAYLTIQLDENVYNSVTSNVLRIQIVVYYIVNNIYTAYEVTNYTSSSLRIDLNSAYVYMSNLRFMLGFFFISSVVIPPPVIMQTAPVIQAWNNSLDSDQYYSFTQLYSLITGEVMFPTATSINPPALSNFTDPNSPFLNISFSNYSAANSLNYSSFLLPIYAVVTNNSAIQIKLKPGTFFTWQNLLKGNSVIVILYYLDNSKICRYFEYTPYDSPTYKIFFNKTKVQALISSGGCFLTAALLITDNSTQFAYLFEAAATDPFNSINFIQNSQTNQTITLYFQ
jgi:hypothetical protein